MVIGIVIPFIAKGHDCMINAYWMIVYGYWMLLVNDNKPLTMMNGQWLVAAIGSWFVQWLIDIYI